nr:MAG TPA: hypothetical protein [Caudoviricetes sp.]
MVSHSFIQNSYNFVTFTHLLDKVYSTLPLHYFPQDFSTLRYTSVTVLHLALHSPIPFRFCPKFFKNMFQYLQKYVPSFVTRVFFI